MKKIFLLLIILTFFSLIGSEIFAADNLKIKQKDLENGTVGLEYNEQIQAEGGAAPYTFSLIDGDALPLELGKISDDGRITGIPKQSGFFSFTVQVRDSDGGDVPTRKFWILIETVPLKITTNPAKGTIPSGRIGELYQGFTFEAEGGVRPYTWENTDEGVKWTTLKELGLDFRDGKISGVPIKFGTLLFKISVQDSSSPENKDSNTFMIVIENADLEITTGSPLPPGQKGIPYIATMSARGGKPPYTWSGDLPPGFDFITKNDLHQISGTSAEEGTLSFSVLVKDEDNTRIVKDFSILIKESCKCSDGTICGQCNTESAPLYCNGDGQPLINNPICDGSVTNPPTTGDPGGGIAVVVPKGKLEVGWPNSPMGTPLNEESKLTDLIKYIYEWGIGLGGFAAFIALVIAGFQYLTSVGNAGRMGNAMKRMQSAGLGLVLLLSSFLILNTINPQLTELKIPQLPDIEQPKWNFDLDDFSGSEKIACETVELYQATNHDGDPFVTLGPAGGGMDYNEGDFTVQSVKMINPGGCQLNLYQVAGGSNVRDNPYVQIQFDVNNVGVYGATKFKYAEVINLNE